MPEPQQCRKTVLSKAVFWCLAAPIVALLSGDWYVLTLWLLGGVFWCVGRMLKPGPDLEEKGWSLPKGIGVLGMVLNLGSGGRFLLAIQEPWLSTVMVLPLWGGLVWLNRKLKHAEEGPFLHLPMLFGGFVFSLLMAGWSGGLPLTPFSCFLWLMLSLPFVWPSNSKLPFWMRAGALINLALSAAFGSFYVNPMQGQIKKVDSQEGVRLILQKPGTEFRWVQEGCRKGRFWIGQKHVLTEKKAEVPSLYRNGDTVFKGGYSTDNGAVDCERSWVMFGARDPSGRDTSHASAGRVVVLDEESGEKLFESSTRYKYTGLDYDPKRKRLLVTRETDPPLVVLDLQDLSLVKDTRPQVKSNAGAFCGGRKDCFVSLEPGKIRLHKGPNYRVVRQKRLPSMAIPQLTFADGGEKIFVSQFFWGQTLVLNSKTLEEIPGTRVVGARGIRYLRWWPRFKAVVGAGYADGYLYLLRPGYAPRPLIFMGRKSRELNISRDGKALLWCAASACFEYRPEGSNLE